MSQKRILICDDVRDVEERWQKRLKALFAERELAFDVEIVGPNDFPNLIKALEERRTEARSRDDLAIDYPDDDARIFDEADILIIDYDLLGVENLSYVTGEDVAYLARCYSGCGLIIALNQFEHGQNVFDLTLRGHPETFADLNIGDPQLDNSGLWSEPWAGFRPWAWPLLPLALEKFEQRVQDLNSRLSEPILKYIGIVNMRERLPRSTIEFITKLDAPIEITFKDFVERSGNGLRRKDKPFSEESIARIAAARITQWLEYLILPSQDILVDAPHLIARYPSLLGDGSDDINAWNKTASFVTNSELGLDTIIDEFRFRQVDWIIRPTWFWNEVSKCEDIKEIADPWSTTRPDWVFCEEISRFLPRNATQEFVMDLPSQFVRRFVVDLGSSEGKQYAEELKQVEYRPVVRFSL